LTVVNVNPSLGYRVNDAVSVGAGLDLFSSQLTFKQFIPWSSQVPGAPDGKLNFDADGDGVGWNLGARLNVAERHHLSATYRSSVKVDYDGDFKVSQTPPPLLAMGLGLKSDFSTDIEFPAMVVVGYGLDLTRSNSHGRGCGMGGVLELRPTAAWTSKRTTRCLHAQHSAGLG
jgi:long-subunit fatty acid transport protein